MMNNKFKTAICKHFEQTGTCKMGNNCHFAHGPHELRNGGEQGPNTFGQGAPRINRPKPGHMSQGFSGNTGSTNNYKTVQCKYFAKGACKFDQNCTFAHGDVDVRQGGPQQGGQRPPKTYQNTGGSQSQSAGGDSNIQNQIAQVQIQTLGTKLEAYHAHDQEILQAIRRANDLIKGGNVQEAASILYSIMNRPDKRDGDIGQYSKFQGEIQSLGNMLFEDYQSQLQSQQSLGGQGQFQGGNQGQQQGSYSQGGFSQGQGGHYSGSQESYGSQQYGGHQGHQSAGHQGGYGGSYGGYQGGQGGYAQ